MTLSPEGGLTDLAVINLVRNDHVAELSQSLDDSIKSGELIINLRAEADPEVLLRELKLSLASVFALEHATQATLDHIEAFKPGQPKPTHRDVVGLL
jgi:hypothetical protein